MSEKKQKLELTWIGKEKRPRHGQAKSLEILAKVAAVGPMKKSGADDGRARSPSAPPAAAVGAWAATETVDGYTWTYRIIGDTAEILV